MEPRKLMEWFLHESSLHSLFSWGTRDIYIILLSRFLRMFAYGGAALVLAVYLYANGNNGTQIGSFLTMALLGDAVISYFLTLMADRIGRRRVLLVGSLLMSAAGICFWTSQNYYVLLFAAIVGVITPGAHEVGPFRAVEESTLAQLTPAEARTDIYAWFAVTSTLGMSTGLFTAGVMTQIMESWKGYDWKTSARYPPIFMMYTIIGVIKAGLTFLLTDRCEPNYDRQTELDDEERDDATSPLMSQNARRHSYNKSNNAVATTVRRVSSTVTAKVSRESRPILFKLCFLFALNSFASGMLPVTLMSWYASWKYRWFLSYRIGYAMGLAWIAAAVANLFSASVARRLGLIRAMVFTHVPNTIFLAFIPLASDWKVLLTLLVVSAAFGSMDQAPRSAFVAAAFLPEERTAVMGTLNLVRTIASAGGPLVTGYFHEREMWWAVFEVAALLKFFYDLGLLGMFVKTKLPESGHKPRDITVADVDVGILLSERFAAPEEFEDEDEAFGEEEGDRFGTGYGKGH